jgi:hypothetical protein
MAGSFDGVIDSEPKVIAQQAVCCGFANQLAATLLMKLVTLGYLALTER